MTKIINRFARLYPALSALLRRASSQGAVIGWLTFWAGLGTLIRSASPEVFSTLEALTPGEGAVPYVRMIVGLTFIGLWVIPSTKRFRVIVQTCAVMWASTLAIAFLNSGAGGGFGIWCGAACCGIAVNYALASGRAV